MLGALPGPLAQELSEGETIEGDPTVYIRQGGKFLRPMDPYASGWWQRIAVRRKPPAEGAPSQPQAPDSMTALQFTVLTDRARLEQEVSVAQRTLVQQLIGSATGRQNKG